MCHAPARLECRPVLRHGLARVGYFAVGAIYAAMGVVAARIAFLGSKDRVAGMSEALRFLLARPNDVPAEAISLIWPKFCWDFVFELFKCLPDEHTDVRFIVDD